MVKEQLESIIADADFNTLKVAQKISNGGLASKTEEQYLKEKIELLNKELAEKENSTRYSVSNVENELTDIAKNDRFSTITKDRFNTLIAQLKKAFPNTPIKYFNSENVKALLGDSWENIKASVEFKQMQDVFNENLKQVITGKKIKGKLQLGLPKAILKAAGVKNNNIVLETETLLSKSGEDSGHKNDKQLLFNLPTAINRPLLVFSRGARDVIVTEVQDAKGNNFIAVLEQSKATSRGIEVDVNNTINIYPKDDNKFEKWLAENGQDYVLKFVQKEKVQTMLGAKTANSVANSNTLKTAVKVVENFENPKVDDTDFQVEQFETNLLNKYLETGSIVDDEDLLEKYNLKRLVIQNMYGIAHLNLIIAKEVGNGDGTKFMKDFVEWADKNKIEIALTPDASFGATSKSSLEKFYKKFGFVQNRGKNKLWNTTQQMVRIQFLKTHNGTIYGFVKDSIVHLSETEVNANTPIHEFGHIWEQLFPKEFAKGIELLKSSIVGRKHIQSIKENPNYANKTDAQIEAEALVTAIGDKGETIFNNRPNALAKFTEWLKDFFAKIGERIGNKLNGKGFTLSPDTKFEDFTKMLVGELLGGKELKGEQNTPKAKIDFAMDKAIQQADDTRFSILEKDADTPFTEDEIEELDDLVDSIKNNESSIDTLDTLGLDAKSVDYVKDKINGKSQNTAQPKPEGSTNIVDSYNLTNSGKQSPNVSRATEESIGINADLLGISETVDKMNLADRKQDAENVLAEAQNVFGGDILNWATKLFAQTKQILDIKNTTDDAQDNTKREKQVVVTVGLQNAVLERIEELRDIINNADDTDDIIDQKAEEQDLTRLLSDITKYKEGLGNTASRMLNLIRLSKMFRQDAGVEAINQVLGKDAVQSESKKF